MKKWKKFFTCFMVLLVLVVSVSYSFCVVRASSISVPGHLYTSIDFLLTLAVTVGILEESDLVSLDLSDAGNQANAERERELLNQCLDYYQTYGGDSSKICYMTADGSVVSLEKALQDATAMSVDDYIDMRKESNSPTPQPGIDWGTIFIDNAVGGLMDFLAGFFKQESGERETLCYTGDAGYVNRTTGECKIILDADTLNSPDYYIVKSGINDSETMNLSDMYAGKKYWRACWVVPYRYSYSYYWNDSFHTYSCSGSSGYDSLLYSNVSEFGETDAVLMCTNYSSSYDSEEFYVENKDSFELSYREMGASGYPFGRWGKIGWPSDLALYGSNSSKSDLFKDSDIDFSLFQSNIPAFVHFSTNIPIFGSMEEAKSYLTWGGSYNAINTSSPPSKIDSICNNYKNKVVSVNSVNSYGVTPTPTPKPTNTPTPKPTNTPTPTPTPYPTWDKNSGNGNNFTMYNFYTEINNDFTFLQVSIDNIKDTVTNIYNFFIIDVDVVSEEINTIEVLPTDRFTDFVDTFANLKSAFVDELQGNMGDSTSQFGVTYPKLKVQSPKILLPYVPDEVKLIQDDKVYIVLCDCEKYAYYFSMIRTLLKALIWFGFIFYLLKELRVTITLNG